MIEVKFYPVRPLKDDDLPEALRGMSPTPMPSVPRVGELIEERDSGSQFEVLAVQWVWTATLTWEVWVKLG